MGVGDWLCSCMEPELVLPGAIQQSPRTAREDTARLVAAKLIQGIARRKWWTVSPSVRRQRHLFNACTLNLVEKVQEICGNSPSLVTDVEHETVSLRLRRTPLHIASACGSTAVVSYLIEKGADLQAKDANGLTPLHYAAQDSLDYFTQYSSVICLHEDKHEKQTAWKRRYTKVGDGGQFADCATLICKTHYRRYKRAAFIEGLLEVRCDQAQQTALHKAAACGKTAVLEVLIRFGANVSVSDSLDRSSLHLAAWVGSDEAISLLLKAKGDPLAVNRVGRTALHVAATYGHNASVKLLLEAGAPINAINYNNNTALHLALLDDFESTAEVLVRAGAETYTPNVFGETPLLIAVEKFPRLASIMLDNCVSVHNQSVLTHSKTMKYCFSGLDLPASVRFGVVKRQSNVLALVRQALGENNMVRGNCSHSEAMPPGLQPLTAISPVSPVASPCDSTPEPTLDPNINSAWLPHYGRVHICSELAASSQSLLRSKPLGSPRNAACGFPGNSASPLEVMVARGQRQMVSHPVIRHLLECKWDAFGKRALFLDAALHLLLTLLWLCATVAFGESCETAGFRYNVSERGACGGLHLFSMLGVFACFVAMLMTEVVHKTWQSWSLSNFWSLYDPAAALVGLVLGMFCLVVNQTEQGDDWRNTHRVMFAVVSLLIWFRWLQYLGALRFTGPFIKVMSRLTRDTGVFVCVYVVFLLGFAHTFYLLLHDTFGDTNPIEFESFPQSLLTTFLILAGTFSFDLLRTSSLDFPATLLCASCVCVPVTCGRYIAYVLLVSIAMINLLIALFFDSYDKVKLSTEQEWRLGWAQRILKLQRRRMSAALNIEEDMIVHEDVYDESETKQEEIEAMAADLSSFKDDVTASLTGLQAQMGELSATVARLADGLDANRTEK